VGARRLNELLVDEDLLAGRAQEAADGLMSLLALVVRDHQGRDKIPGVVVELLRTLQGYALQHQRMSATGHDSPTLGMINSVRDAEYLGSRDAARRSGLSDRHIRRLVGSGDVAGRRVGERGVYLVDGNDLQRYLRGESA
jgi:hypothetical protein